MEKMLAKFSSEHVHADEQADRDDNDLAVGDVDHVAKDLGWLGIFSAGFNITNTWLVIAATMTISLQYGPMASIWGVLAVTPIYLCIGLTLAELISAYPTTGGQYHWTSIMAPASIRPGLSYTVGFLSWFSWMTLTASSVSSVSLGVYALVYNAHPDYDQKMWHSFLIYEAINGLCFFHNVVGKKLLPPLYKFGMFLSLSAFVVFSVTPLAMQPHRQASAVVWTSYTTVSGWPAGLQFLIALSSPVIAFCPLDGAVHLVEEVRNARVVVPRTVLVALFVSVGTSLVFVLAMLYTTTDFDAVLATPSGFPLFEMWHQATGTTAVPIVFTIVVLVLLPIGSIACFQVAAMMTLSLARDHGLPFAPQLSRINRRFGVPLVALALVGTIIFLIGILALFSTIALNSIVGVAVILQQITVAVPAALVLYHRRGPAALPPTRAFCVPAPLGWISNIVTVAFTFITTVFLMFPSLKNPTANEMNYAVVVSAGALLAALLNWVVYARKHYRGPAKVEFHD